MAVISRSIKTEVSAVEASLLVPQIGLTDPSKLFVFVRLFSCCCVSLKTSSLPRECDLYMDTGYSASLQPSTSSSSSSSASSHHHHHHWHKTAQAEASATSSVSPEQAFTFKRAQDSSDLLSSQRWKDNSRVYTENRREINRLNSGNRTSLFTLLRRKPRAANDGWPELNLGQTIRVHSEQSVRPGGFPLFRLWLLLCRFLNGLVACGWLHFPVLV